MVEDEGDIVVCSRVIVYRFRAGKSFVLCILSFSIASRAKLGEWLLEQGKMKIGGDQHFIGG